MRKRMLDFVSYCTPKILYRMLRSFVRYCRLFRAYFYDLNLYYRHSMSVDEGVGNKLIAKVIKNTHVIEKGLTMPASRAGFGIPRMLVLMSEIESCISGKAVIDSQVRHAISVVREYFQFHNSIPFELPHSLTTRYEAFESVLQHASVSTVSSSQRSITREEYFSRANASFDSFARSRSSLRNFSSNAVNENEFWNAIDLARTTPSACNRQSVRLHVFANPTKIKNILEVQGGNRGFGHLVNRLVIVTYETSMYFEASERSIGLVDGGMYCMNLLYTLHASSIGACILNAAHSAEKDKQMRAVSEIPSSEVFVAFIACGIPPDNFKIATSFRYPLTEIITEH